MTLAVLALVASCGGRVAFERHYPVTVRAARDVVAQVLVARYRAVQTDGDRRVTTRAACAGDDCVQIDADVVGTDGDVRIRLGGRGKDAPREIDRARVEIDRRLAGATR